MEQVCALFIVLKFVKEYFGSLQILWLSTGGYLISYLIIPLSCILRQIFGTLVLVKQVKRYGGT